MIGGLLPNGAGSCPAVRQGLQPHFGAWIAGVNVQLDVRPASAASTFAQRITRGSRVELMKQCVLA
jgi:hypothetical protein